MHRGIMVYGPTDPHLLMMQMAKFGEDNNPSELMLCHRFPHETSAGLMISQITDMIQNVQGRIGHDFLDAFIVMPEEDATPPWHVDYGPASYVLTYKKDHDYCLYAIHRNGLYDWWVPGGRWSTYLQAKDPLTPDAHIGGLPRITLAALAAGIPCADGTPGTWAALPISAVDWEEMDGHMGGREFAAITMRKELAEKGVTVPTYREYFHQLYPALKDQVGPDAIEGFIHGRQFDVYMQFRKMVDELRVKHGYPKDMAFAMEEHRWSNTLLERLGAVRAKVLTGWIIGGVLYDLDDLMATEEHINKGLDALEALSEDTIVSVVDVHY